MNRVRLLSFCALGGAVLVVPAGFVATRPQTVKDGVTVSGVDLGGLPPEEAARKLRQWWEVERRKPLELTSALKGQLPALTPSRLGVTLDDAATVAALPLSGPLPDTVGGTPEPTAIRPVFKVFGPPEPALAQTVARLAPKGRSAEVRYRAGAFSYRKEESGQRLDAAKVGEATVAALGSGKPVRLPLEPAPKRVPDDELRKIRDVVSTFSTRFSAGNRPRSSNIKLASAFFDGKVLMPGERISYNDTVGRRTVRRGFREAGVYVNGMHDTGVGGGICQVSTTLYNAALLADMKIVQRRNHSLPVPYVPLGQDATVDYGNVDLVLENAGDTPIAVSSLYTPGRLTFRILGQKDPTLKVRIERGRETYSGNRMVTRTDRSLPPGARRVVNPGSPRRTVSTWRVVTRDGQTRRDSLGTSVYGGFARVIAVGPSRPRPAAPRSQPTAPSAATPPAVPSAPSVPAPISPEE